ncbi:hypothetical protein LEMLEM_LOCUS307, partial [Lemmus lemmus]
VEPGSHRVPEKAEVPGPGDLPVEPLHTGRGGVSGSRRSRGGGEFLGILLQDLREEGDMWRCLGSCSQSWQPEEQ